MSNTQRICRTRILTLVFFLFFQEKKLMNRSFFDKMIFIL